ncbi:MAG: hypothetical protein ACKVOJ_09875 [Sphingomonadaceae bacterium]
MRALALILASALAVTGSTTFAKSGREVPAATETGAPVSCLHLTQIRESRVRSDQVIDFRISGNKWYRNTLPHSCPSLGFEERFLYQTSLSELCSVDIITVLQNFGGQLNRGASCGLGKFQPVDLVKQ